MRQPSYFILAALWVGLLLPARAGYQLPPEMLHATPEQKKRYIQVQSELMLHEKLQAGEQRYAWRRTLRLQLIEQAKAVKEEREEEINGNPAPTPAPAQNSENSGLALVATVLLIPGAVLLYRRRIQDADYVSFFSLLWDEVRGSFAHIAGQTSDKFSHLDAPVVVRECDPIPTTTPQAAAAETTPCAPAGGKFGRIKSMRVCLDITPEAREFISEASIFARVELILRQNQIRIEDKSPIWLTLSVAGDWDERCTRFHHREELALVESITLIRKGHDMQTAFVSHWGSGYGEFVKEQDIQPRILASIQQLTDLFADAFVSSRTQPVPS